MILEIYDKLKSSILSIYLGTHALVLFDWFFSIIHKNVLIHIHVE